MSSNVESKSGDGLKEKLVAVNRTAKVVAGGRNFRFTALVVVGDGQGMFGFGLGKAPEVPDAIRKAMEQGRKNMRRIELKGNTIHYEVKGKFGATRVLIKPAAEGTGVIAGGPMRAVFEVIGVENILAKVYGSSNPINVVRATVAALMDAESPEIIAQKRGKNLAAMKEKGAKA
jgi:small subunit ribosomal protein S5